MEHNVWQWNKVAESIQLSQWFIKVFVLCLSIIFILHLKHFNHRHTSFSNQHRNVLIPNSHYTRSSKINFNLFSYSIETNWFSSLLSPCGLLCSSLSISTIGGKIKNSNRALSKWRHITDGRSRSILGISVH